MAEKETRNKLKDLIEATPEAVEELVSETDILVVPKEAEASASREKFGRFQKDRKEERRDIISSWVPKTAMGKLVKEGKEKDIDKILKHGKRILESQIVDSLLDVETDLLSIGQAKGKFGGGKRRAWRQTQKKTMEGNVLSFSAMAVTGDKKGHIGVGYGKARETLPSRDKAIRDSKLNIFKIGIGFESPELESEGAEPHTVPFKIEGKCGSVKVTFWPAPRGTGLSTGDECKKILKLAGIKDVYSRTRGNTRTTFNLAKACINALEKTTRMKK